MSIKDKVVDSGIFFIDVPKKLGGGYKMTYGQLGEILKCFEDNDLFCAIGKLYCDEYDEYVDKKHNDI